MIDGKNFFGLPVKIDLITWNIATGQGDDYTTGFCYIIIILKIILI